MKRTGVAIALAACCLLAAAAAGAAKDKKTKIASPFSWEVEGKLLAESPLKGCRAIRTEQEWAAASKLVGAEGFPIAFSERMLLLCAVRQDKAAAAHFTKAEPGEGRLEAVMAIEPAAPQGGEQAATAPVLLLFHLIEVPKYDGPVRISFEISGPQQPSPFPPVDLPAANPTTP